MFKYISEEWKISRGNMWERGLNIFIKSVVSNKPVLGLLLREQPLLSCMSVSGWQKVSFPASLSRFMAIKEVPSPSPKPSWENQPTLHPLAARGQGESWMIPLEHVSVNLRDLCSQQRAKRRPVSLPWPHDGREVSIPTTSAAGRGASRHPDPLPMGSITAPDFRLQTR